MCVALSLAVSLRPSLTFASARPALRSPTIMIAWGIVMTLMSLVTNYTGLLIARFFLGALGPRLGASPSLL